MAKRTRRTKEKFLGQEVFFDAYQKFIKDSYKGNRIQKDGTKIKTQSVDNYQYTYKLLRKFVEETGFEIKLFIVPHLTPKELKKAKEYWQQFYFKFTDFLYRQGYYDNYVGFTIKNLRVFFNYMINEQHMQVGMFHKKFPVPKEDIQIVVFTPEQLNYLIYNEELESKLPKDLKVVKDIFVFGCTVALRICNLMSLKPFNLVKQGENTYLKVRSQKTATDTLIKLPDYAIQILSRYKNKQRNLLPAYSVGHFNRQLKVLAGYIVNDEPMIKVRMKKGRPTMVYKDEKKRTHYTMADHITTHTMRRTAITTMLRLGMPEQLVRRISGHAPNSREFYKYVAFLQSYFDQETEKAFEKLSLTAAV